MANKIKALMADRPYAYSFEAHFPDLEIASHHFGDRAECDILIFSGGEDVSPARYGHKPGSTTFFNENRDAREFNVFDNWLAGYLKAKRVLAVCRGIQLVNVALGGNLIQDLGKEGKRHPGGHEIKWEYESSLPFTKIPIVNSMHHQAVRMIGDRMNYRILAREPKTRVVESILWGDSVLGVQFHPEFFPISSEASKWFFDSMRAWIDGESLLGKRLPGANDYVPAKARVKKAPRRNILNDARERQRRIEQIEREEFEQMGASLVDESVAEDGTTATTETWNVVSTAVPNPNPPIIEAPFDEEALLREEEDEED